MNGIRLTGFTAAVALLAAALSFVPAASAAPREVELDGTIEVGHADDFAHGREHPTYVLHTAAGAMPIELAGGAHAPAPGSAARASGHRLGGAFHATKVRRLTGVSARHAARAAASGVTARGAVSPGARTVAVVLLNFSNDTRQPFTPATARSVVFTAPDSVSEYYREETQGAVSLTGRQGSDGDVFGWYTVPQSNSGCRYATWARAARDAATAEGVDLSGYDHVVYVWPRISGCQWSGLGELPGDTAWINGSLTLRVIAHELGHNLILHHASSLSCQRDGAPVAISPTCDFSEYGDPFDIMGSAQTRRVNGYHAGQLEILRASNTVDDAGGGDYTLAPLGQQTAAPQVLRVPRGDGTYYYVDFRQPFGSEFDAFSPDDPAVNGVGVRIAPDYDQIQQSELLDTSPETPTFLDAALAPGNSFDDPDHGITIRTVSAGPTGATVTVGRHAVASPANPAPAPSPVVIPGAPSPVRLPGAPSPVRLPSATTPPTGTSDPQAELAVVRPSIACRRAEPRRCTVSFLLNGSARALAVRLKRGGVTLAEGRPKTAGGGFRARFHLRHRPRRGSYKLVVKVATPSGAQRTLAANATLRWGG